MDVKELCVRRCVDCRKSQHVTTCETSTQNGHMDVNTINQVCCGIFKNHERLEVFIFGWKGKIHLEEEAAPRSRWQPLFLCSLFRKFDVCSET